MHNHTCYLHESNVTINGVGNDIGLPENELHHTGGECAVPLRDVQLTVVDTAVASLDSHQPSFADAGVSSDRLAAYILAQIRDESGAVVLVTDDDSPALLRAVCSTDGACIAGDKVRP